MELRFVRGRLLVAIFCAAPCAAQVTERVSLSSSGAPAFRDSSGAVVSADGRFVGFTSLDPTLVPGDTNGYGDAFLRDRVLGTTELVSLTVSGGLGDGYSALSSMSPDARFLVFMSRATNMVPGDSNGAYDVFVRDRATGTTEIVSVSSTGVQGNAASYAWSPVISADGRYVVFWSEATNLVPGDTNGALDVFVRDRQLGTTQCVSVSPSGSVGNGQSFVPSISADGRFVAFVSCSSNLDPAYPDTDYQVYVRDLQAGTTETASVSSAGILGDYPSGYITEGPLIPPEIGAAISADGRSVAFVSFATNLVPGDGNSLIDVFVRDLQNRTTERVNVSNAGAEANGHGAAPSISADGRYVAFQSDASNLVAGPSNAFAQIYVRDRQRRVTTRESVSTDGTLGNGQFYGSESPSISADGRYVGFFSDASNLVPNDTNGAFDVFLRDRRAAGATSVCEPALDGVQACPCSNPPSSAGRGCDNSASTGGAILSAKGIAYLSMDSLVFTTQGQSHSSTGNVFQGSTLAPAGMIFGQGVRCAAGTLRRLYTKTPSGGGIRAPDFAAGDPPVSARSAALGDVIQPGASRWYFVCYRDAVVLGGCPASSTFNATQTVRIDWSW